MNHYEEHLTKLRQQVQPGELLAQELTSTHIQDLQKWMRWCAMGGTVLASVIYFKYGFVYAVLVFLAAVLITSWCALDAKIAKLAVYQRIDEQLLAELIKAHIEPPSK